MYEPNLSVAKITVHTYNHFIYLWSTLSFTCIVFYFANYKWLYVYLLHNFHKIVLYLVYKVTFTSMAFVYRILLITSQEFTDTSQVMFWEVMPLS